MNKNEERGFTRGIVLCAAWLVKYHGEDTIAKDMLNQLGIKRKDAEKAVCDNGDMQTLIGAKCF